MSWPRVPFRKIDHCVGLFSGSCQSLACGGRTWSVGSPLQAQVAPVTLVMRFAVALPLTWSSSHVPWGISGAAGHPAACTLQLLFPLGVVPGKGIAQPSPGSACACTDQPQRWSRNCTRRWVPHRPPPALGAGVCPLLFSGGSCHAARASRSAALRRCRNILVHKSAFWTIFLKRASQKWDYRS